jgi:hypothetical protein
MGDCRGLFSRAARSNTQRFGATKKMELLLIGQPPLPPAPKSTAPLRKSIQEELLALSHPPLHSSEDRSPASFTFLSQSREKFYTSKSPKHAGPPPGAYSVSYTQVDKHNGWADVRSAKVSRLFSPPENPSSRYLGVDTPKKKLGSAVIFSKQVPRSKHWIGQNSAHEKRFSHSNLMPGNASKFRKSPSVKFGLLSPRSLKLFPGPKAAPDHYNPRKSTIMPRSPICIFPKARTPRFQVADESPPQHQVYTISPKTTGVDWSRQTHSKSELDLILPRYMMASTSRLAIQEVNEKTLRVLN